MNTTLCRCEDLTAILLPKSAYRNVLPAPLAERTIRARRNGDNRLENGSRSKSTVEWILINAAALPLAAPVFYFLLSAFYYFSALSTTDSSKST